MNPILKLIPLLLIVVIILGSVSACGEPLPPTDDITRAALAATANISNFKVDMDLDIETVARVKGNEVYNIQEFKTDGIIDLETGNMKLASGTYTSGNRDGTAMQQSAIDVYIFEDRLYAIQDGYKPESEWIQSDVPEEFQSGLDYTGIQTIFFSTGANEATGRETVKQVECYVLKVTPDISLIRQLVAKQLILAGEITILAYFNTLGILPENTTVRQWVSVDTGYIIQTEAVMTIDVPPDEETGEEREITIRLTIRTFGHNEAGEFRPPFDALKAEYQPGGIPES